MKYLACFLLLSVLFAIAFADDECKKDDVKKEDCNSCRCIKGKWACTRIACPKPKRATNCTPGEKFRAPDGCNTCVCSSNGQSVCTQKACL